MAQPRSIGKYYWHPLIYPVKPPVLWERAETQEIDGEFRFGAGVSLRVPFTRVSLVIGKWIKSYDERQALTNAINGRSMSQEEVDWDKIRYGADYDF
jgi:hypothetical protein